MIDVSGVTIESINFFAQNEQEIHGNLKVLFTTPVGTVPFDRNFGIDTSFIDEPLPVAQSKMVVEYRLKARLYEPRAIVQEVIFIRNNITGNIVPRVVINIDSTS